MKSIMTNRVIRNAVLTVTLLLPLQFGTGFIHTKEENKASLNHKVVLMDLNYEYCDTRCYLSKENATVEFLSKTVGIDKNTVVENLIEVNKSNKIMINNIGQIKNNNGELIDYGSFEKGLIEYLLILAKNNPSLVNNKYVPYEGNSEYVVDLIKYFTKIYDNVDYLTAVSIGAAESGYYKVKYMLRYNNIYGGMSSKGLIRHKTIEYGVLSYVRLLSNNYYSKGLDTKEKIGRVYCPTFNEYGEKVASSHWIGLVNKAMKYYENSYEVVEVNALLED